MINLEAQKNKCPRDPFLPLEIAFGIEEDPMEEPFADEDLDEICNRFEVAEFTLSDNPDIVSIIEQNDN